MIVESPTEKASRFDSFVLASVRAVWLPSGIHSQRKPLTFSLFSFGRLFFIFSVLGGPSCPFPCTPHPQTSYPTLLGFIGVMTRDFNHSDPKVNAKPPMIDSMDL